MASTAKRLHGPAQVSGSTTTKYTVPALTKTRVRHVHLFNPSGAAVTFTMSIGADAAGIRLFDAFSVPAGAVYDWYPYAVLDVGEIIAAHAGTANVLTLTIFGDELTLG